MDDIEDFPLNDKGYWLLAMILYASMTEEQKKNIPSGLGDQHT